MSLIFSRMELSGSMVVLLPFFIQDKLNMLIVSKVYVGYFSG